MTIVGVCLSGVTIVGACLSGMTIVGACLSGVTLVGACLSEVTTMKASLYLQADFCWSVSSSASNYLTFLLKEILKYHISMKK